MGFIDTPFRSGQGLRGLAAGEEGTSATEFSLFVPVILFGCLTMGDIGLALHQRMTLDHIVRAGAQVAMADPGEEKVLSALRSTATKNFVLENGDKQNSSPGDPVSLDVARYCSCPDARSTPVSCSDSCAETVPPFVFYRMSAAKTYDGIFVPAFSVGRQMDVQIR